MEQPEAAAAAMLLAWATAGWVLVRRMLRHPPRAVPLRRCPLCGEPGLRALEYEVIDSGDVLVRQQCGQCGVWRDEVTPVREAGRHERRLEAERSGIRRRAELLERRREMAETDTFVAALRDEIVGAEDLLALIIPTG